MPSVAAPRDPGTRAPEGARGRPEEPLNTEARRIHGGRPAAFSLDWPIWIGPLLALAFGVLDLALDGTRLQIVDPGDFQVAVVVVATLVGGVVSGVATALVGTALLFAVHAGRAETQELAMRVVAMLAAVPVFGIVGRTLRRTTSRRLRRAASQRVLEYYRTLLEDLGAVVWEFDLDEQR